MTEAAGATGGTQARAAVLTGVHTFVVLKTVPDHHAPRVAAVLAAILHCRGAQSSTPKLPSAYPPPIFSCSVPTADANKEARGDPLHGVLDKLLNWLRARGVDADAPDVRLAAATSSDMAFLLRDVAGAARRRALHPFFISWVNIEDHVLPQCDQGGRGGHGGPGLGARTRNPQSSPLASTDRAVRAIIETRKSFDAYLCARAASFNTPEYDMRKRDDSHDSLVARANINVCAWAAARRCRAAAAAGAAAGDGTGDGTGAATGDATGAAAGDATLLSCVVQVYDCGWAQVLSQVTKEVCSAFTLMCPAAAPSGALWPFYAGVHGEIIRLTTCAAPAEQNGWRATDVVETRTGDVYAPKKMNVMYRASAGADEAETTLAAPDEYVPFYLFLYTEYQFAVRRGRSVVAGIVHGKGQDQEKSQEESQEESKEASPGESPGESRGESRGERPGESQGESQGESRRESRVGRRGDWRVGRWIHQCAEHRLAMTAARGRRHLIIPMTRRAHAGGEAAQAYRELLTGNGTYAFVFHTAVFYRTPECDDADVAEYARAFTLAAASCPVGHI